MLIATAFPWATAGELAMQLARVGCTVEAVAPRNSVLHRLPEVTRSYRLGRVRPVHALRHAMLASRADLVVPFDDRTRQALHQIYDHASGTGTDARLRKLIERSLGPPETYPWIYSRATVMGIAAQSGVRCPATAPAPDTAAVVEWMAHRDGWVVMKTDGSWGGREVAVARDSEEAVQVWRQLSRPPHWARIVKRLAFDRDPWPLRARLRGEKPVVSMQAYVDGSPANVAAGCLEGELLGIVGADVVRSDGPFGPSTVISLVDDPEMEDAARTMARSLGLTGLCGFDFVRDSTTGLPYLVEVNPRATPTAHLALGEFDLLTALRDAHGYSGPPARLASHPDGEVVVCEQKMRSLVADAAVRLEASSRPWIGTGAGRRPFSLRR